MMQVKDVMRKDVITIEPQASIKEAIGKMVAENITCLIVEERGSMNVYGIVTRKDIVNKVIAHEKNPATVKVADIMSEPILSVSSDITIEAAARLMAKTDMRRFPVIEGGKLIGLISNSDILRAAVGKK
jgi:CBS domain-containing protein